jgi:hypothetical protein
MAYINDNELISTVPFMKQRKKFPVTVINSFHRINANPYLSISVRTSKTGQCPVHGYSKLLPTADYLLDKTTFRELILPPFSGCPYDRYFITDN